MKPKMTGIMKAIMRRCVGVHARRGRNELDQEHGDDNEDRQDVERVGRWRDR